jgi:hypothetical protein
LQRAYLDVASREDPQITRQGIRDRGRIAGGSSSSKAGNPISIFFDLYNLDIVSRESYSYLTIPLRWVRKTLSLVIVTLHHVTSLLLVRLRVVGPGDSPWAGRRGRGRGRGRGVGTRWARRVVCLDGGVDFVDELRLL